MMLQKVKSEAQKGFHLMHLSLMPFFKHLREMVTLLSCVNM
jgi:hypothetical protein